MSILGNVRPWPAGLSEDPDIEAAINSLIGVSRAQQASQAQQSALMQQAAQATFKDQLQPYNYNNALNNTLSNAIAQVPQPHTTRSFTAPLISISVGSEKLHEQIRELVKQLPMSIAGSIQSCSYYMRDHDEAARFVVMFANQRTLTFYDVDEFPSAEHIGRIALECP